MTGECLDFTEEQKEAFSLFERHYKVIKLMADNGVFDIREGSTEIHFDKSGQISKIHVNIDVYKRRS